MRRSSAGKYTENTLRNKKLGFLENEEPRPCDGCKIEF
jgi:hypothetical protein